MAEKTRRTKIRIEKEVNLMSLSPERLENLVLDLKFLVSKKIKPFSNYKNVSAKKRKILVYSEILGVIKYRVLDFSVYGRKTFCIGQEESTEYNARGTTLEEQKRRWARGLKAMNNGR